MRARRFGTLTYRSVSRWQGKGWTLVGTRERILQVAMELFCEHGVQRTSMQDIAAAIGVTKPALYYHFRSRHEIVESLMQPMIDDVATFLSKYEGRTTPDQREVLNDLFDLQYAHRTAGLILLRELTTLADVIDAEAIQVWRHRTLHLLTGPDPTLDQQLRAGVAIGGLADATLTHVGHHSGELKESIVDGALGALRAGQETQR